MKRQGTFPFTAIIGQEDMKKALVLNVVNPRLGVVIFLMAFVAPVRFVVRVVVEAAALDALTRRQKVGQRAHCR